MPKLFTYRTVGQGAKLCRVHEITVGRSKSKGELMANGQLKIKEGEYEGETLFFNAMLEGKGAYFGNLRLSAIRPDVDWTDYDAPETDAGTIDERALEVELKDLLKEEEVIAVVVHKPNPTKPGQIRAEVSDLFPADADIELEDNAIGIAA